MGDEITSNDSLSSTEDEITYDDSKKEAIEKEWRVWLKAYENQSNWYRDMPCFKKLQNLLYQSVEGECWEILVEAYEKVPLARKARMPNCYIGNQTALHLLVARSSAKDVVEKMLRYVDRDDVKIKDEEGNTILHRAAAAKDIQNIDICKLILSYFPDLIEECNNYGKTVLSLFTRCYDRSWSDSVDRYEAMINSLNHTTLPPHSTPLHVAVRYSNEEIAKKIFEQDKEKKNMLMIKDEMGNTVLHSALLKENFKLAYQILQNHPSFSSRENKVGWTPLRILTNKPYLFRSRTPLTMVEHIFYSCIWVVDLEDEDKSEVDYCREVLSECFNTFKRLIMSGSQMMHKVLSSRSCCLGDAHNPKDESESAKDLEKPDHEHIIEGNKENSKNTSKKPVVNEWVEEIPSMTCTALIKCFIKTCMARIKSFIKICMFPLMIIVSFLIQYILPGKLVRKIKNIKRRHMLAYKIMEKLLLNYEASCKDPRIGNATILLAAEKGITEMVEGILKENSSAAHCSTSTGLNTMLVAIKNRQADVYELLTNLEKKGIFINKSWTDNERNNVLHLAATRSSQQPWGMPTTMQLLWEIKWYNYVRDTMPDKLSIEQNKGGKTPSEVFMEEHKDLLQKNDLKDWLNSTSQSCSVVAGLVATVAYSSATTIPGGNNQEGVPYFKGHPAFGTFVISAFMALCFSLISLILFLTILISPYLGVDDANKSLPTKVVVALFSLLASIGAMLVSFCGGHFFFLKGTLTYVAAPFYVIGCLVIGFLLFTQFNSYTSLLWSLSRRKPRPWYDHNSLVKVVNAAYI